MTRACLHFLETAWSQWVAAGYKGEIIPTGFPARGMQQRRPDHIDGKVGYYCLSMETAMTAGTWEAAKSSAAVALTARQLIAERCAFGLRALPATRPSRPSRSLRRLLLPQQRGDRRAGLSQ